MKKKRTQLTRKIAIAFGCIALITVIYLFIPKDEGNKFVRAQVTEEDLDCAISELPGHVAQYYTDRQNGSPLSYCPKNIFTIDSYKTIADAFKSECSEIPGMIIHYGLDTSHNGAPRWVTAFTFHCLKGTSKEASYTMPSNGSVVYRIDSNNRFHASGTYGTWLSTFGKNFSTYVKIKTADNGRFKSIYKEGDGIMVYKLDQIDKLISHNSSVGISSVEVVPVAEPLTWTTSEIGSGFSLKTCLVGLDGSDNRLIDSGPKNILKPYKMRGSDLGSGCPPNCIGVAFFPSKGIDVREECLIATPLCP